VAGLVSLPIGTALAQLPPPPAPLSYAKYLSLLSQPNTLRALTNPPAVPPPPAQRPPAGAVWQAITNPAPFSPGAMLLLTDGTVMVQDQGPTNVGSGNWWRLAPDLTGSYLNGTWSQLAAMPTGYAPLYFASAVLPDGRVIVEGGEYNGGALVWTNQGAIYNPLTNTWTSVAPPSGSQWSRIGDAPGTVLANGVFMLGASGTSGTTAEAMLNAKTLTWTITGSNKADGNGEEGWSLLPAGDVLTVDTGITLGAEIYNPAAGAWTSAGSTVVNLVTDGEIGPQLLIPNGTVFAAGAAGPNAVYKVAAGTWSAGPSFPVIGGQQYDVADGPAAILPEGYALVMASPGEYQTPFHFFVYTGSSLVQQPDPPNAASLSSFYGFMTVLPTGQVMFNSRYGAIYLFTDPHAVNPKFAAVIATVATSLTAGVSYQLTGKQLSGLTQGAAYGDDYQSATNYPLVRIVNTASGHVFYARTFGDNALTVAPKRASGTGFTVPDGIETGASMLYVVANGIASAPVAVTVSAAAVAAR
jgi:hypothetical protein